MAMACGSLFISTAALIRDRQGIDHEDDYDNTGDVQNANRSSSILLCCCHPI